MKLSGSVALITGGSASIGRAIAKTLGEAGDLDILVNNFGIGTFKDLVDMDTAGFERVFATNVNGIIFQLLHQ